MQGREVHEPTCVATNIVQVLALYVYTANWLHILNLVFNMGYF